MATADKKRTEVRVERVDTKCGAAEHMCVDEIRARIVGDGEVDLACPACGQIHLTPEDALEAGKRKLTESERYQAIKSEAEDEH